MTKNAQEYGDYVREEVSSKAEEYGDYMSVNTSNLRLSYEGIFNKTVLNVSSFYQIEDDLFLVLYIIHILLFL